MIIRLLEMRSILSFLFITTKGMRVVCASTSQEVWRKGLKFYQCTFAILFLSPLGKRYRLFFLTNLNPLHPKDTLDKSALNWPGGSGEEDFLILSMYFRYFVINSSWKWAGPFI